MKNRSYQAYSRATVLSLTFAAFCVLASCATVPESTESLSESPDAASFLMEEGKMYTEGWNLSAARDSFDKALSSYASTNNREGIIQALLSLGWNVLQDGDPSAATEYYYHASELAEASGDGYLILDVRNHQADLALRLGDPVEASSLLENMEFPDGGRVEQARMRIFATALDSLGNTNEAILLLESAVENAAYTGELNEQAQAAYRLAVIHSRLANFEDALRWAQEALESDTKAGYPPGIAVDLWALAIIAVQSGDEVQAEDYYRRAWLAYRGMGRESEARDAAESLEKLTGRRTFLP